MKNIKKISLDLKIEHRNWEEAMAMAFSLLISVSPGEVVCITGPSRAGKTRLIQELCRLLVGAQTFEGAGVSPAVVVEAANTGPNGTFLTKAFTLRMLEAVGHPMLAFLNDGKLAQEFVLQKVDRITEPTLRGALEKALRARGVKYLFIDEAQHARYVSKDAQGPSAVMDSWKCLAKAADVVLVIVGAYPILNIINNSPHLIGRKHQVHLPRYQVSKQDLKEFAAIIKQYEMKLSVCDSLGGLLQHVGLLYRGSVGCIGLLRGWLLRAASYASVRGVPINREIILQTRLSDDDLTEISKEILAGEKLLSTSSDTEIAAAPKQPKTETIKKRPKPFQQKPVRRTPGHRTEVEA